MSAALFPHFVEEWIASAAAMGSAITMGDEDGVRSIEVAPESGGCTHCEPWRLKAIYLRGNAVERLVLEKNGESVVLDFHFNLTIYAGKIAWLKGVDGHVYFQIFGVRLIREITWWDEPGFGVSLHLGLNSLISKWDPGANTKQTADPTGWVEESTKVRNFLNSHVPEWLAIYRVLSIEAGSVVPPLCAQMEHLLYDREGRIRLDEPDEWTTLTNSVP